MRWPSQCITGTAELPRAIGTEGQSHGANPLSWSIVETRYGGG